MKVHKKKLKSLKMDVVSESRQGALAAANANLATAKAKLTAANYTFTTAKAKLAAAMNLRIKG